MEFTVLKNSFQLILSSASKFCMSSLSSIPALTGGLIKLEKNTLSITTTNLNEFFNSSIKVEGQSDGKMIVDIKKIVEFLNFLPEDKIKVELKNNELIIKDKKTQGVFSTIKTDDFPGLPVVTGKKIKLTKAFIEKNLPLILFSAASDAGRPHLTGVNFITKDDKQYLVATDGFRLSLTSSNDDQKIPESIIPANFLNELLRLIGEEKEIEATFSESEKIIEFKIKNMSLYTRLIEGEFPPFDKVIPANFETRITLEKDEFLRNIKLSAIFAREFSSVIIFDIKKDGLYIKPKGKVQDESVVFQEAEIEGKEQKIAFNYKFILDFLNNSKSNKVIFEMTRNNAPGLFRLDNNKNFVHVIMPIRTEEETG